MEVHLVDVGQGECSSYITPNNKVMFIDGGNIDDEDDLVAYLIKFGVKKVDILIGTHPDADYISGITEERTSHIKKRMDSVWED